MKQITIKYLNYETVELRQNLWQENILKYSIY